MSSVSQIAGFEQEVRPKLVLDREVVLIDVSGAATQVLIAGDGAWHLVRQSGTAHSGRVWGVVLLETSVALTKYGSVLVILPRVAPPVFKRMKHAEAGAE